MNSTSNSTGFAPSANSNASSPSPVFPSPSMNSPSPVFPSPSSVFPASFPSPSSDFPASFPSPSSVFPASFPSPSSDFPASFPSPSSVVIDHGIIPQIAAVLFLCLMLIATIFRKKILKMTNDYNRSNYNVVDEYEGEFPFNLPQIDVFASETELTETELTETELTETTETEV